MKKPQLLLSLGSLKNVPLSCCHYYYHLDYVLEEMDFESERKWKLAQAKKVALKASK
ncbi:Pharynx and intestine in excess protein 1, partial [Stylosanthes scabra]|nr:Pharynx and intestine in excess protein 1 [Stylosanthes scabra]